MCYSENGGSVQLFVGFYSAVRALRGCGGALVGRRRRPRRDAKAAPLQSREALTARPPADFWRKTAAERQNGGAFSVPPFLFCDFPEALFSAYYFYIMKAGQEDFKGRTLKKME